MDDYNRRWQKNPSLHLSNLSGLSLNFTIKYGIVENVIVSVCGSSYIYIYIFTYKYTYVYYSYKVLSQQAISPIGPNRRAGIVNSEQQ